MSPAEWPHFTERKHVGRKLDEGPGKSGGWLGAERKWPFQLSPTCQLFVCLS